MGFFASRLLRIQQVSQSTRAASNPSTTHVSGTLFGVGLLVMAGIAIATGYSTQKLQQDLNDNQETLRRMAEATELKILELERRIDELSKPATPRTVETKSSR
ncbi:uncharacterized protein BJ171DRAFT_471873 [Polychytrium aggregatum]|uniref:uncharacterized protein n=1 Tax=Polychytrium aggregatum TaxID=110093 RepID=UPI0022FEEEC2|nr:uncharacterized protein BJ171DRAFT_471873 [Polychytrium aggregatum]KAI9208181.1 hypothetical protein BJ171DRAFT_471873 [Polychytrium aggregatum]